LHKVQGEVKKIRVGPEYLDGGKTRPRKTRNENRDFLEFKGNTRRRDRRYMEGQGVEIVVPGPEKRRGFRKGGKRQKEKRLLL